MAISVSQREPKGAIYTGLPASDEIVNWPEFKALAKRLGIDCTRPFNQIVIDLTRGSHGVVIHRYAAADVLDMELVSAGVDPKHQTEQCDHCQSKLQGTDSMVRTCGQAGPLTLCLDCYRLLGSAVR